MSAELVEEALKLPKYKEQLQEAEIQVPAKEDPRGYRPQPQVKKEVLPTVWSPEAHLLRAKASKGKTNLVDDGGGGMYDAAFYVGMSDEERKAWDKASDIHFRANNAELKATPAELMKLQALHTAGEITSEEYLKAASSQPLGKDEEKEVKEMQMKGDLLKTIGEQDQRIKNMEGMMAQLLEVVSYRTPKE